jgi:hypothetical protein
MLNMPREEILLLVLALEDTCEPVQTRVAKRRGIARRKLAEELRELIGADEPEKKYALN